jgi:acyl-Coa thioesterase superfamily protein/acyl-CoA thioesterase superfamily protein
VSFYEALGGGRFRATEHTSGPWDPEHQHAGPPAALLGGELERHEARDGAQLARVTFEILGPVPIADLDVAVGVERPGRSVELLAGELRAGDRTVVRARAWRVRRAVAPPTEPAAPPALPEVETPRPPSFAFGYGEAIEWRWASGAWLDPGPAEVWTRLRHAIVDDREPTPLQRVLAVADSGNGVSAVLDWRSHVFINPELTVHVLRPPEGEWVCLQARTEIGAVGLAHSILSDRRGPVARGAQCLLVAPR